MPPVGALCFYQAHFGRTSSTLCLTMFHSLGGHASARRVSHKLCFCLAHCFMQGCLRFLLVPPKSHMCPLPPLGLSIIRHQSDPSTRQKKLRKILVSVKIFARDSGAGNGCANLMGAWRKCVLSAGKIHADKIPRFRGGRYFGFWGGGGGSADFLILWARGFF